MGDKTPTNPLFDSLMWTVRNWMPAVAVAPHELQPDNRHYLAIARATADIHLCREMFSGWKAELAKAESKKYKDIESRLFQQLDTLEDDINSAMRASENIVLHHAKFAQLTAQRIETAAESSSRALEIRPETSMLAEEIANASRGLSMHMSRMRANLRHFVETLEQVEDVREREKNSNIAPTSWVMAGGSVLSSAGAELCRSVLAQNQADADKFHSIIQFLKTRVPEEAQTAQTALARFDEAHVMLGLETVMKTGRRVVLGESDVAEAASVSEKWRSMAREYSKLVHAGHTES
ncbi:hypothetical protein BC834DRAFT_871237 [Gloeopeniophorella convolvens]|nr:hypothetical protein BC834DRAFT_871237 [Gloeopeniophorella convolvens]